MKNLKKTTYQLRLYAKRKWKKYLIPLIVFKVVKIGVVLAIALYSSECKSQSKYWIFLKDKSETTFDPYQYFDKAAIDRRNKLGINLYDSTDFPISQEYIRKIENSGVQIITKSRWMNALSVQLAENQKDTISTFSFVKNILPIESTSKFAAFSEEKVLKEEQTELLKNQIGSLQGEKFIIKNITGKGVRIAIFDGGFPRVDKLPYFEHIRKESRIIKTYDFVRKKEDVYGYNPHGTMTFSNIAGIADSLNIGLATGAEFLLARTETWTEFYSEEENWLAAVEWADKNGARIISSSLGYTFQRYRQREMDGHTSLVARAAALASKKGILVVSSMGNDATNYWEVVCTPADEDSVLSVGGIDPETMYHIKFSSFGPTADMRLKPNVSAFGSTIASGTRKLKKVQGTSFSTPLVAGFAACVMQLHPEWTNMQVKKAIEESASFYPYYDYAHGYGVPQASYFTDSVAKPDTTFDVTSDSLMSVKVKIREKYMPDSTENASQIHFYYNISKPSGVIRKYYVVAVYDKDIVTVPIENIRAGEYLRFHYKGFTRDFFVGKKE